MSFIQNKQEKYEAQLTYLLQFISGHIEPHQIGFATYCLDEEKQSKALHRACLDLERGNLIERWFECPKLIVWKPKSIILTDTEN